MENHMDRSDSGSDLGSDSGCSGGWAVGVVQMVVRDTPRLHLSTEAWKAMGQVDLRRQQTSGCPPNSTLRPPHQMQRY